MTLRRADGFGGTAGLLASEAFSLETLVCGAVLTTLIVVVSWMLANVGLGRGAMGAGQVLVAIVLARYAQGAAAGTEDGLRGGAGLPWSETFSIALRYAALSLLFLVPLTLLVGTAREANAIFLGLASGEGFGGTLAVVTLLLFAVALSPPAFLVIAVAAESFAFAFSPALWVRMFSGRMRDLLVVYVTYTGALVVAATLGVPFLALAASVDSKLAVATASLLAALLVGIAVSLLGSLCGSFAAGGDTAEPAGVFSTDAFARPAGRTTAYTPGVAPPTTQAGDTAGPDTAAPAAAPKPPLLDGRERVEAARRRFEQDRPGAIAFLEDLRASYAPNTAVLHALCLLLHAAGEDDSALAVATEAIPLCHARGNVQLAAEMVEAVLPQAGALGLSRDQLLTAAESLRKLGRARPAGTLYAVVLKTDAGDARAIKGLIQAAEHLDRVGESATAVKMFDFVLQQCPASPLIDFTRQARADAERRIEAPRR